MQRDLDHLKLLSLFHYILGGLLAAAGTIGGVLYVLLGVLALAAPPPPPGPSSPPATTYAASVLGWTFVGLGAFFLLLGCALAAGLVVAGRCLARHRGWTYCFIIACILCANAPVGTVLGLFTILVLLRPSVKDLFEGKVVTHDPEEDDGIGTALPPEAPVPGLADNRIFAPRRDF